MSSAPNPWEINYFDPPNPHTPAPSPRVHAPKPIPEIQDLFRVQRNALKVLNDVEDIQHLIARQESAAKQEGSGAKTDHHLLVAVKRLRADAEDAYRVINTYLRHHQTEGTL